MPSRDFEGIAYTIRSACCEAGVFDGSGALRGSAQGEWIVGFRAVHRSSSMRSASPRAFSALLTPFFHLVVGIAQASGVTRAAAAIDVDMLSQMPGSAAIRDNRSLKAPGVQETGFAAWVVHDHHSMPRAAKHPPASRMMWITHPYIVEKLSKGHRRGSRFS